MLSFEVQHLHRQSAKLIPQDTKPLVSSMDSFQRHKPHSITKAEGKAKTMLIAAQWNTVGHSKPRSDKDRVPLFTRKCEKNSTISYIVTAVDSYMSLGLRQSPHVKGLSTSLCYAQLGMTISVPGNIRLEHKYAKMTSVEPLLLHENHGPSSHPKGN